MTIAKKSANIPTFAEGIAEAEAAILAKLPELQTAAEVARALAEQRATEAEGADAEVSAIRAAFSRGVADVTAEEFAAALAGVERAELLVKGSKAQADRATKAVPLSSKALATVVADAVREALPGVQVVPTFAKPHHPEGTDGLPVAFVVSKSEIRTGTGQIKGDVEVIYYRTELFTPLDPRKVDQAFTVRGWSSREPRPSHMNRGLQRVDTLHITDIRAHDSAPVIRGKIETRQVDQLGRSIAYGFINAAPVMTGAASTISPLDTGKGVIGKGLTAEVTDARCKEQAPDTEGVRRIVAEVGIKWRCTRIGIVPFAGPSEYARTMRAIEATYAGRLIPGMGTVEKVEPYAPETQREHDMQVFGYRFVIASREA